MKKMLCALTLVSTGAMSAGFTDSNLSPLRLNPAQSSQEKAVAVDTEISFQNGTAETGSNKDENSGYLVTAGGSYAVEGVPLFLGLHVTRTAIELEKDAKDTSYNIVPKVSYNVTPEFSVGYEADFTQVSQEVAATTTEDDYVTQKLGALYTQDDLEAGLVVSPKVDVKGDIPYQQASTVTLHGRYRFNETFNAGLLLKRVAESEINDAAEDYLAPGVSLEWQPLAALELEGLYQYKPENNKDQVTAETAALHWVYVAGDYLLQDGLKLGAFYDYVSSSAKVAVADQSEKSDFEAVGSQFGIRSTYSF